MAILNNRALGLPRIGLIALACLAGSIAAARAERVQVRSEVDSLALVLARDIPAASGNAGDRALCGHWTVEPATEAGRLVAARGWAVTGEVALAGGARAVSFAGKFEQGTSGSCRVSEGNVAIFRDGALLAIAYAPQGSRETIGKLEPLGNGQSRIWGGDYFRQPIADLHVEPGGPALALVPLAAEEALCGGKAVVPNIYGMPIDRARKLLRTRGWLPVSGGGRPEPGSRAADLAKSGITEVESCSGTGFGFCGYGYRGPSGTLSVTTVGDGDPPAVSGYDVACR